MGSLVNAAPKCVVFCSLFYDHYLLLSSFWRSEAMIIRFASPPIRPIIVVVIMCIRRLLVILCCVLFLLFFCCSSRANPAAKLAGCARARKVIAKNKIWQILPLKNLSLSFCGLLYLRVFKGTTTA